MYDKKQIDEIAKVLNECCNEYDEQGNHIRNKCSECDEWSRDNHCCCSYGRKEAEALYDAGYRKQGEGHWEKDEVGETLCSECGVRPLYRKCGTTFATTFYPTRSNFCPNCGANMKGGAE